MTLRKHFLIDNFWAVIFLANTQHAYQLQHPQQDQFSAELSFCAKSSTGSTLRMFWREATIHCAMDANRLIDVYEAVSVNQDDKCSLLLHHHLRKTLVDTSGRIYAEALISNTFRSNVDLDQLSKRLSQLELHVSQAVWERAIDEVYLYMNKTDLARAIFHDVNYDACVISLLYLYQKYLGRADFDTHLPVVMTYYLTRINQQYRFFQITPTLKIRVGKMLASFPQQLRLLYTTQVLGLLNTEHSEYLYAPRAIGPDSMCRTALTWIAEKNSSNSDSHFKIELNRDGDVAFGSVYGENFRHLYVDEEKQGAYFWMGTAVQSSRWWRPDWHEDHFTFTNVQTQQVLCASLEYDEERRFATLRPAKETLKVNECHWIVVPVANIMKT